MHLSLSGLFYPSPEKSDPRCGIIAGHNRAKQGPIPVQNMRQRSQRFRRSVSVAYALAFGSIPVRCFGGSLSVRVNPCTEYQLTPGIRVIVGKANRMRMPAKRVYATLPSRSDVQKNAKSLRAGSWNKRSRYSCLGLSAGNAARYRLTGVSERNGLFDSSAGSGVARKLRTEIG